MPSDSPTVSLSVVTHDDAAVIAQMLSSLREHCGSVETWCIDNASRDSTIAAIKSAAPWARLVANSRNVGFGAAHNQVLGELGSDFHAIVNPDVVFIEDALTPLAGYLEQNPDVAMVTPRILNADGTEQKLPKLRPHPRFLAARRFEGMSRRAAALCEAYTRADECFEAPVDIENATGSFLLIRTEVFRKLGGFDPRFFLYFEDNDLSLRAARLGRVVFHPGVAVVHHYARAARSSLRIQLIQLASALRFFAKHGI
jgi:GT2 family glycosyltransferase